MLLNSVSGSWNNTALCFWTPSVGLRIIQTYASNCVKMKVVVLSVTVLRIVATSIWPHFETTLSVDITNLCRPEYWSFQHLLDLIVPYLRMPNSHRRAPFQKATCFISALTASLSTHTAASLWTHGYMNHCIKRNIHHQLLLPSKYRSSLKI